MIILDTHAWLWLIDDPHRLSRPARRAIDRADGLGVCTISCWELAMLTVTGRVLLDRAVGAWVASALADPRVVALDLRPDIAVGAALLDPPGLDDPADRIIYSTAQAHGVPIVTRDSVLANHDGAATIW